jgi:hypothetical protein
MLAATKKNPGQCKLPGFRRLLPCRFCDPGGFGVSGGWGSRRDRTYACLILNFTLQANVEPAYRRSNTLHRSIPVKPSPYPQRRTLVQGKSRKLATLIVENMLNKAAGGPWRGREVVGTIEPLGTLSHYSV